MYNDNYIYFLECKPVSKKNCDKKKKTKKIKTKSKNANKEGAAFDRDPIPFNL